MIGRAPTFALAAVVASALLAVPCGPSDARPVRLAANSVAVTVDGVDPVVLPTTTARKPLTVTLTVTNRSNAQLNGVVVEGERGEPKNNQAALDDAIKHVSPPIGHVVPIEAKPRLTLNLAPGESRQVVFHSTTSTLDDGRGLCNCSPGAIYPLYFSAHMIGHGGVDQSIGLGSTFVSSFYRVPAVPVRVAWVWPLVDQPHLLDDIPVGTAGPVFADDFLAASVGTGGRLDRSLTVLERIAAAPAAVPMTVVVDPGLLDELELMATGPYQVRSGSRLPVAGTGGPLALAWLNRLRSLLDATPQFRVQLTPYADPDVESLHAAGLRWSATLPADMGRRVDAALGGHAPATTVAWPARGAVSSGTLDALVDSGVGTVLLRSSALQRSAADVAVRPGLARIASRGRDVAVGVLDDRLERYVQVSLTNGASRGTVLPQLIAELAIRIAQEPTSDHLAVLTPPRWVDPSVDGAVRVIEATSRNALTAPISLAEAVAGELLPNGRSRLAPVPAAVRSLPASSLAAIRQVRSDVPALRSLLTPVRPRTIDPQAAAMLAELPLEGQRVTSAAWGQDGNEHSADRFAHVLTARLDALTHGVTIVTPSSGSYTLASDNSPLPITVHNGLPYPVTVVVHVSTENGEPGFTARPRTEVVEAQQKATVHLATKVDRTGRIRLIAELRTPDGQHGIGYPVTMTVRSTALGTVGIVITIVAGAVLALALIVRFGRRLRGRLREDGPDTDIDSDSAPGTSEPEALSAVREPAERAP